LCSRVSDRMLEKKADCRNKTRDRSEDLNTYGPDFGGGKTLREKGQTRGRSGGDGPVVYWVREENPKERRCGGGTRRENPEKVGDRRGEVDGKRRGVLCKPGRKGGADFWKNFRQNGGEYHGQNQGRKGPELSP